MLGNFFMRNSPTSACLFHVSQYIALASVAGQQHPGQGNVTICMWNPKTKPANGFIHILFIYLSIYLFVYLFIY